MNIGSRGQVLESPGRLVYQITFEADRHFVISPARSSGRLIRSVALSLLSRTEPETFKPSLDPPFDLRGPSSQISQACEGDGGGGLEATRIPQENSLE